MLIFAIIFSVLLSPSENDLFKKLFLIKYSQEYNLYKNDINFDETELKSILKKEIEDRLILYKEARKELKFDKNLYFQKIFDLKQQYNTNNLELIAVKNNIPKKIILKNIELDTYIDLFLKKLFKNIKVTNKEIENYYYSHLDKFTIKKEILLYHIFSESKPKIIKVLKKLEENKKFSFGKLAYKYSEAPEKKNNGLIGWVTKKDLPSYFDLAFKIKKGKYSKIVQSNVGYHIFYVKNIKSNQYMNLNDVKNKIRIQILSNKQEIVLNNFINQKRKELTKK